MATRMQVPIPGNYRGLREALGASVDADHHVGRLLAPEGPRGPEVTAWLDRRYEQFFLCDRVRWEGDRRERLCGSLQALESFASADAEVQAGVNLVRHAHVHLVAQAEGDQDGVRTADLLVVKPHPVEVEVRAVGGLAVDVETERIESALLERVSPVVRGKKLKVTLRVRRVRDSKDGPLLLDDGAQKRLVQLAQRLIASGIEQGRPVYITLPPDGNPAVFDERTSLDKELASIELSASEVPLLMHFGGMHAPPGREEVRRAIKRKRGRGQHSDANPWVLVVDVSNAPMLEWNEMNEAATDAFRTSRNLSAVVIQRRRVVTPGWGVSPTDPWFAEFKSTLTLNPNAERPLPPDAGELFQATEIHALQ